MRGFYQYCKYRLPVGPLFLMLLKAFADGSAGKQAKAQPIPSGAVLGNRPGRTRRPDRGRPGPVKRGELGIRDRELIPIWSSAACQAKRHPGQSPSISSRFGVAGASGVSGALAQAFRYGSTERTLSRVRPFTVGGQKLGVDHRHEAHGRHGSIWTASVACRKGD